MINRYFTHLYCSSPCSKTWSMLYPMEYGVPHFLLLFKNQGARPGDNFFQEHSNLLITPEWDRSWIKDLETILFHTIFRVKLLKNICLLDSEQICSTVQIVEYFGVRIRVNIHDSSINGENHSAQLSWMAGITCVLTWLH